jgi:hypothetical protein
VGGIPQASKENMPTRAGIDPRHALLTTNTWQMLLNVKKEVVDTDALLG